jgi:hypothetical protein
MSIKILGKQLQLGIARQTNWATPVAANGAFKHIFADAGSVIPDPDVQVDEDNLTSGYGVHSELERSSVDSTSGIPKISYTMPVDVFTFAPHIISALQGVNEADIQDNFEKAVFCGGRNGVIDFNGNAGYLHTLALNPVTSGDAGMRLTNAIIDQYNLTIDFNARGRARKMQASVVWAGNELMKEETLNGVWTKTTPDYFHTSDTFAFTTLTLNGVNWVNECVRRFELNIQNNVARNCVTGQGKANQWDISPVITGSIILDLNAVTEKVIGDYMSGSRNLLNWTIKNGVDTRTFKIMSLVATKCMLTANPFQYNDDFLGVALQFQAKSENGGNVLNCSFTDGNDWGY